MIDLQTTTGLLLGCTIGASAVSAIALFGWRRADHAAKAAKLRAKLSAGDAQFWQNRTGQVTRQLEEVTTRIHALRSNCFLTDERGHRVRYSKASANKQQGAEGIRR